MLHIGWKLWQRKAFERADREEFAEFAPTFAVAGDTGIEVAVVDAEFDAEDGFDVTLFALIDPLHGTGRIVDIGQCQGREAAAGGAFCQVFRRDGAVLEGVI